MTDITFDYGNVLPEFRNTGTSVDARIRGLKGYSARRLPALEDFNTHFNKWLEGDASKMDADRMYQGLALMQVLAVEMQGLGHSVYMHAHTNTPEELKRYKKAVDKTLKPILNNMTACMKMLHTVSADALADFTHDIPIIEKDAALLKTMFPVQHGLPFTIPIGRPEPDARLDKLFNRYGMEAVTLSYFDGLMSVPTEVMEQIPVDTIKRKLSGIFTDQLRVAKDILRDTDSSDYLDYLSKECGIPRVVSRALYAENLPFTFMESPENEISPVRYTDTGELIPETVTKDEIRKNIDRTIEAYREFSPRLGERLAKMVADGNVHITMPNDDVAVNASGMTMSDGMPYTRWTGNRLMINLSGEHEARGGRVFAHEASHGLDAEARKYNNQHVKQDLYMAELIAHVGEYIVLEKRLRESPDIHHAINVAQQAGHDEDGLLFQNVINARSQHDLLHKLPRWPRKLAMEDIRDSHMSVAYEMVGFSPHGKQELAGLSTGPIEPSTYSYDMIDEQAYSFAIIGARAFARKLFTATPEEREKISEAWTDVIENSHNYTWGTAMRAVGIDVYERDFVEKATHFSRELIELCGPMFDKTASVVEDNLLTRGKYVSAVEAERAAAKEAPELKRAGGRG